MNSKNYASLAIKFAPFTFLVAAIFLVYSPLLAHTFAFADDYFLLDLRLRAANWYDQLFVLYAQEARPLLTLPTAALLCLTHHIKDLWLSRFFGIVWLVLISLCFYLALLRAGWNSWQSAASSLCLATVPAFEVLTAWGFPSCNMLSVPFAYLSVRLIDCDHATAISGNKRTLITFGLSCLLLCMSAAIYQPGAMFCWVFAAIALFGSGIRVHKSQLLLYCLLVAGIASASNIALLEWGKHHFGTANLLPGRSNLSLNIAAKIAWFVSNPLVDSLNFNLLSASHVIALSVGIFIAAAFLVCFEGTVKQKLMRLLMAVFLLPLCYLPNLAVSESWSTYRTQMALACLVVFYMLVACRGFLSKVGCSDRVFTTCALIAATVCGTKAFSNILVYFAIPQELELKLITRQVTQQILHNDGKDQAKKIVFFTRDQPLAPAVKYDEFGMPSSAQIPVQQPMVDLIKHDLKDGDL